MWRPPIEASSKVAYTERLLDASSAYPERADFYLLNRGSRQVRTFEYEYIPAAHIFPDRASDPKWADVGQVGLGDDHNALWWLHRRLAEGNEAIVVHFEPNQPQDLEVVSHAYEVVRLEGARARGDFSNVVRLRQANGELYDVELPVVVSGATTFYY